MSRLALEEVGKTYPQGTRAVAGVRFELADGELLALVGPSGCGKTTLLRLIAGLEDLTTGRIQLRDRDVSALDPRRRNIAMVFQHHALYPHLTVRGNLAFPLRARGRDRAVIADRVERAAVRLGLEPVLEAWPETLSGGQRQRVALGRALVRDPDLFLFDEPLSHLDPALRVQLRREIKSLVRDTRSGGIYVTHDKDEALSLGDRLAVMNAGRIEQIGAAAEVYRAPATRFVAGFLGVPAGNQRAGRLVADGEGTLVFEDPAGPRLRVDPARSPQLRSHLGRPLVCGIRPEGFSTSPSEADAARIAGRAAVVEFLGPVQDVLIDTENGYQLTARLPSHPACREGDALTLFVSAASLLWFEADGAGRALA